jgi:hypothetical protein
MPLNQARRCFPTNDRESSLTSAAADDSVECAGEKQTRRSFGACEPQHRFQFENQRKKDSGSFGAQQKEAARNWSENIIKENECGRKPHFEPSTDAIEWLRLKSADKKGSSACCERGRTFKI